MSETINSYFNQLVNKLKTIYSDCESENIAFMTVEHVLNYSKFRYSENRSQPFPETKKEIWKAIEIRLLNSEPIQYVLGEADFFGLKFKVDNNVLIPRQETEELVQLILTEHKIEKIKLLDIGTGSGCIPVSLKKNRKNWDIYAIDISKGALKIATENAKINNAEITLLQDDICNSNSFNSEYKFNVIVSNPPYIPNKDVEIMHNNVKDFEPHLALFSPDDDPLIFYKHIAEFSKVHLEINGTLYVEIHEKFANEVSELFKNTGFNNITIINDINEKARIAKAKL
ncbi:MAG: peptide chain release factor N(5)-glutamine methyltransferase [Bacteroidia bacterium]|nr:peptide chain release factor N(5)-glutamine methyltransferase [Bacteroidia bacterium]